MTTATAGTEDTLSAAVDLLAQARQATLACHVAPDGDALGSMLALGRVLRARGVEVTCTWGDADWAVPASYAWLPDIDTVVSPLDVLPDPEVFVVLDTASRDRLGVLAPVADSAGAVLVVDHHAHNTGIDGVHVIDPTAAATAVLVTGLIEALGAPIDAATATLLYVGLVTDTGSFQHSVVTPAVHAVAGRLIAAGAQPQAVAQRLWGERPFGFVQVLGAALGRVQLESDAAAGRGWVWTWTTRDDLDGAGIAIDEIEAVIDVVRATREADVATVLKQDRDGTFKVSMRSRGGTDVGAVGAALGGGGHRLAAGYTSTDGVEETARRLRDALAVAPAP